jgi:hypothetical protein
MYFFKKILLISLLFSTTFFLNCTQKPEKEDNEIIADLIMEYARKNVADFASFEIIEISQWDSVHTEMADDKKIVECVLAHESRMSDIEDIKETIQKCDEYVRNLEPLIVEAQNKVSNTTDTRSYEIAKRELHEVMAYEKEAKKLKQEKELDIMEKQNFEIALKESGKKVFEGWEKQHIGKKVELRFRYKNRRGRMDIGTCDVLCNDSLTEIISVKDTIERHSKDGIKILIDNYRSFCYK